MKSDRDTYCNITSEDLKNYQKTRSLSKLWSEAGLNLVEIGQFFYALPFPNGVKNQSLCREYTLPRDEKETCAKGRIESDARFGPVSDMKDCKTHGRYSFEVEVPSLFEDQTTSRISIVNGVEKYVREAMLIQEEERASGKPAAKSKPKLKPSSPSNWNFIPVGQRKWIDIEGKRSKDPYCFQMSKFMTQLLRHKEVGREEDAGVPRSRIVALYWSADKWIDILSKGGGQNKRFQYCLKPNCREKLLYLRATQGKAYSGNARINPALQDNVLLPKEFYQVFLSRRKRKGIIVRNGKVPGGFSTGTG